MVPESETGGRATSWEVELNNNFFPEFVPGDEFCTASFANCFVQKIQVQLLPANLRNLKLTSSLCSPEVKQGICEQVGFPLVWLGIPVDVSQISLSSHSSKKVRKFGFQIIYYNLGLQEIIFDLI